MTDKLKSYKCDECGCKTHKRFMTEHERGRYYGYSLCIECDPDNEEPTTVAEQKRMAEKF